MKQATETFGSEPRKIHIWEFLEESYVQLTSLMTEKLFKRAAKNVGNNRKLSHTLNISYSLVFYYRARKRFIPFRTLRQLCALAGDEFSIEQMEPHIVAYKIGGSRAKPILRPKLPLIETPNLFAIMGHLMGDGGHNNFTAYYSNTKEVLIDKFLSLLRSVFGNVPVHVEFTKKEAPRKDFFRIYFGMTSIRLLQHLYNVDFQTFTAQIPQRLFELPQKYASAYLRAFGDDEGCVHDDTISLYSANKGLILGLYTLVQTKFPELSSKIQRIHESYYRLQFPGSAFERYMTEIGFVHPMKMQDLNRILARRAKPRESKKEGETCRQILELLDSSGPMTIKELIIRFHITYQGVKLFLKGKRGLLELGFVQTHGKQLGSNADLFEITERGRILLRFPAVGLISGRKGRSKVEILKTLVGGHLKMKELAHELHLSNCTIHAHLKGTKYNGKWSPGLLELGFVHRSGHGVIPIHILIA